MECAITVREVVKRFQDKESKQSITALNGVDLDLPAGSITALVGPDGAGKTTLLRLIAGLLRPDSGRIQVLGMDSVREAAAIQAAISYMPQRFGLYEDLSIQENLNLYADLHSVPATLRHQRFSRLLAMTGLAPFTARLAGKLSGGMKQKLGLACTLVRSPQLLLLDEPTVGVDPLSRVELWQIISQLIREEQLSVLVSTAYLDEAARCDQVCVLHEGKRLDCAPPAAIAARATGRCYRVRATGGLSNRQLQAQLLANTEQIIDACPQGDYVRVVASHREWQQRGDIAITHADAELEDGFMVLLREKLPLELPQLSADNTRSNTKSRASETGTSLKTETVIEVDKLVRKFGDFTAVDSTSFKVQRGEIFGLLGPNGAGKTTTFRMLCGLLPATSGSLTVAGVNLRHARAQARQNIGYVSQKFALYGNFSTVENLRFYGGAYGLRGSLLQQRVEHSLHEFQLDDLKDLPSQQLPGGYKQRLAMAVGLIHQPEILFLDEPTSGADPLARRAFWQRINGLASNGTTIVVTTHFMEEAEYCDRIVIQDAGRVLALGTPSEVRQQASAEPGHISMETAFIEIVRRARQEAA